TNAMSDVYAAHRGRLNMMALEIGLHADQVGALVSIGGGFVVLDHVSDPEAWDALHGPVVKGYALDAPRSRSDSPPPSVEDAREFVDTLLRSEVVESPALGRGVHARFASGIGLKYDDELIALTAYA